MLFVGGISLSLLVSSCGTDAIQKQLTLSDSASATVTTETTTTIPAADKFKSVDGKFAIRFAGNPQETNQKIPTAVGDIELHMFMYEKSITEAYVVGYSDYPSEVVKVSNPSEMLQGAKGGVLTNLGATLTEENKVNVQGNEGLEFKAKSATSNIHLVYKIFLKGNRLYQIGILRDGSFPTAEGIQEFIGSFELTEQS